MSRCALYVLIARTVLVHDDSGKSTSTLLISLIRRLERWNLTGIFAEGWSASCALARLWTLMNSQVTCLPVQLVDLKVVVSVKQVER